MEAQVVCKLKEVLTYHYSQLVYIDE